MLTCHSINSLPKLLGIPNYSELYFNLCVTSILDLCLINLLLCVFQGLGKSEQGATDHIKVKVKNNSLGLGTNASHEVRTLLIYFSCHLLTVRSECNVSGWHSPCWVNSATCLCCCCCRITGLHTRMILTSFWQISTTVMARALSKVHHFDRNAAEIKHLVTSHVDTVS